MNQWEPWSSWPIFHQHLSNLPSKLTIMCPWNSMVGSDDSFPLGETGLFSGGYVCFGEGMYFFVQVPTRKKWWWFSRRKLQALGRLPDLYVIFVQTLYRVFCVYFQCESFTTLVWLYLLGAHFWDSTKWLDIFGFGGSLFDWCTTKPPTKTPPPNQSRHQKQNRHQNHGLIVLTLDISTPRCFKLFWSRNTLQGM